jgi:uncharacterized protein YfeS
MAKTQTACPQCRQPVLVEVEQVFDLAKDPLAKQKLLSNQANFVQCSACGYQGILGVPVVYHDPDKELLLTFFPPDLNTPVNEQEKQVGPLIQRIMDNLPKEKRKAYLLQPKSMLTYQTLIEKILEADGITKEMLDNQQKRVNLLQRLLQSPPDQRLKIIEQEKDIVDISFFSILSRIIESAMAEGDENSQKPLLELQQQLFENTETGKQLFSQAKETETAIKALQEAGKDGLTREKLLDILISNNSEAQISTIASLARAGLDYEFFRILSEKIENTQDQQEKEKLTKLREDLLAITDEIDKQIQAQLARSKETLEKILANENIEEELSRQLPQINEAFLQVLQNELSIARKSGDLDRIQKLERVMIVIEKASAPPEEVKLLEELLAYEDESNLNEMIIKNGESITQEFIDILNSVMTRLTEQTDQEEIAQRLGIVYKAVLNYSMKKKMKESKS